MRKVDLALKRFIDIVASGTAIILLFPLGVIVGIIIKRDSSGPVFFKQERRTKDGKIFNMIKFRTMVENAENMGAGLFNYKDDPRITKIGRLLRNSSIDELPQLINIFLGDMSIVGPRPCVSYELGDFDTLNSKYKKRFAVKAGLTGLAQVKGRNNNSWEKKVEYDNQYIDLFSKYGCVIDIFVIIKTFLCVGKKENIYENKENCLMSDEEAAKYEEEEIIRLAHLPEEKFETNK